MDNEIDKAFVTEQESMRERGRKVHSLIPLNLDTITSAQAPQESLCPTLRAELLDIEQAH